ncbi:U3 small nucleolar ribonucleoprotein protein MPP10 [Harpegnathos saltator]|uniref:U3 small nucleolar ribonucleoprotein protein MPP10 n=1 Tax=Harpegnathos saltator TaxID=610380 RepID=E2C4Q3_HARSA|nr:U3 small nucleolar ribonucleoprotein protein MPP10 [Harpegnathos saltator]EFN77075.1 U3 small nucleolar ribonucleoprotein protein MPP10 [Harpegnathos saltator]
MASVNVLDSVISTLDNVGTLKHLQTEQNVLDLKNTTKHLYDFTKKQSSRKSDALPELITEGFDEEQIWQQLELQNECELTHFSESISKILTSNKLIVPVSSTKPEPTSIQPEDNLNEEGESLSDDKESEDENIKTKSILKKRKRETKKKKKSSIVDDKFFRLQELNEYLTKEEKIEKQGKKDAESDDESVDLFNDFSEDEGNKNIQGKYLKYVDFFDSPASSEESGEEKSDDDNEGQRSNSEDEGTGDDEEEEDEHVSSSKRVKFNLINDSDETDSLENKMEQKKKDKEEMEPKSSLETRQERLRTRIQELEEEAISEKPWQLKGEVSGPNRPQNSLLEEFVEFDVSTRPAPVITEETTMKLEDVIMQRIKDKAWDDVEKKFKPVETPLEYKKKLVLNQEKSKESLSQIYENEYLKQKQALYSDDDEKEEPVPELHHEIRRDMRSLMAKLDALSNYHYTPKRVKPEVKIISNVSAVNMEEVAPVATSDAAMLAPEEIKAKPRGEVIGKSERTQTDKKRERRRKKLRQRSKQKAIKEKEKLRALKPGVAKKLKKDKELVKKLTKDRNITKADETSHKVTKSSTAFFTRLQDQVKSQVKVQAGGAGASKKKKAKNAVSAVKLKL